MSKEEIRDFCLKNIIFLQNTPQHEKENFITGGIISYKLTKSLRRESECVICNKLFKEFDFLNFIYGVCDSCIEHNICDYLTLVESSLTPLAKIDEDEEKIIENVKNCNISFVNKEMFENTLAYYNISLEEHNQNVIEYALINSVTCSDGFITKLTDFNNKLDGICKKRRKHENN
jgi:hypothetical protein